MATKLVNMFGLISMAGSKQTTQCYAMHMNSAAHSVNMPSGLDL